MPSRSAWGRSSSLTSAPQWTGTLLRPCKRRGTETCSASPSVVRIAAGSAPLRSLQPLPAEMVMLPMPRPALPAARPLAVWARQMQQQQQQRLLPAAPLRLLPRRHAVLQRLRRHRRAAHRRRMLPGRSAANQVRFICAGHYQVFNSVSFSALESHVGRASLSVLAEELQAAGRAHPTTPNGLSAGGLPRRQNLWPNAFPCDPQKIPTITSAAGFRKDIIYA